MNNKQELSLEQPIPKDTAIELLFGGKEKLQSDNKCFDEYGNYIFPTDMVANTPNTAVGTSVGLAFIDEFCLK